MDELTPIIGTSKMLKKNIEPVGRVSESVAYKDVGKGRELGAEA